MDCLANIKFLDALDQPINALAHQLWVGSLLISDHITLDNGESVWIKRPRGTIIDVKIRSLVSAEYKSKVKIQLIGDKTTFIVRSPKVLLKGVSLSVKDVVTGKYLRSTYIVAEGDYLSRIANDNDATTIALITINNLKSETDIHPGQVLKIPVKKSEVSTLQPENKPKVKKSSQQEKMKVIVVQQKDNLPLIAKLTGNTVDEIRKLNTLSGVKLIQNQKLTVYDRKVIRADLESQVETKRGENKPETQPMVKQDASNNKKETPVAKVEYSTTVLLKVSQRNEKSIARLHPQVRGLIRRFINDVYIKHQVQLVYSAGLSYICTARCLVCKR